MTKNKFLSFISILGLTTMLLMPSTLLKADTVNENNTDWFDNANAPTDYAYSFVAIGDIQIVTQKHPEELHNIYDYIIENKESKNIQFVFGLGDITNAGAKPEWELASQQNHRLDGVVPYSFVRGNHDDIVGYNHYFNYDDYKDVIGGSFNETMENTYQILHVGDVKYLIFALDFGPSDAVIEWAGKIINIFSDHNVIITTHGYLNSDGKYLDKSSDIAPTNAGGYNNGDDLWEKLVSKHPNITMVLSGHIDTDYVYRKTNTGVHGNEVQEFLINPQGLDATIGPTGLIAILYFSSDGKNVDVEYYSTVRKQYYKQENIYSFTMNSIESTSPNHTYGDWIDVLNSNNLPTGTQYRECKECNHQETRNI